MKKLTTLLLVAFSSVMLAQIPNNSFENWTSGTPNGWTTENSVIPGGITQSSIAEQGSSSLQINSVLVGGILYVGGIVGTNNVEGDEFFVNAGNPAALTGWYQLTSNGGDELIITAETKCGKKTSGAAFKTYTTSTGAVWKQFSACLVYDTTCTGDSASINFSITNTGGSGETHSGTFALIDNLAWGACVTGVDDINNNVTLEAAYPNPANTICNIIYTIPNTSTVNVTLYDLSGKKVMDILANSTLTPGRYKIPVDVHTLSNGIYAYTLTVDGVPYSQKLVVAK